MSPPKSATFSDRDNQSDAHARITRDGTGLFTNWRALIILASAFTAAGVFGGAKLNQINQNTANVSALTHDVRQIDFKVNALLVKNGLDPLTINRQASALVEEPKQ
jgi:hypothetical protein